MVSRIPLPGELTTLRLPLPPTSASGIPRETREQRQQRRQQQLEQRRREQAQELVRLLAIERSLANAEVSHPSSLLLAD